MQGVIRLEKPKPSRHRRQIVKGQLVGRGGLLHEGTNLLESGLTSTLFKEGCQRLRVRCRLGESLPLVLVSKGLIVELFQRCHALLPSGYAFKDFRVAKAREANADAVVPDVERIVNPQPPTESPKSPYGAFHSPTGP